MKIIKTLILGIFLPIAFAAGILLSTLIFEDEANLDNTYQKTISNIKFVSENYDKYE
jgi:hypothetical protein